MHLKMLSAKWWSVCFCLDVSHVIRVYCIAQECKATCKVTTQTGKFSGKITIYYTYSNFVMYIQFKRLLSSFLLLKAFHMSISPSALALSFNYFGIFPLVVPANKKPTIRKSTSYIDMPHYTWVNLTIIPFIKSIFSKIFTTDIPRLTHSGRYCIIPIIFNVLAPSSSNREINVWGFFLSFSEFKVCHWLSVFNTV